MWNSAFDASSNMEPAIWPNAAAMAEQLWSPKIEPDETARTRLSQQRCRMVRRGVRASPIAEDYCDKDLYVRKSMTFSHPGDFKPYPDTPGP
jgi:hexosaminidase